MIQCVGRTTITGGAGVIGSASITGDPGSRGEVTISGTLAPQLFPTVSGTKVQPAIEIKVSGVIIARSAMRQGTVSYRASLDDFMQSAGFTMALTSGSGFFGNPANYHGPPFGTAAIDITGIYSTPSGEIRLPLITNGIYGGIERSGSRESGYTESWTVLDSAGRIDSRTATVLRKPGHGLTRDRVIELIFSNVGVTRFRMQTGAQMFKAAEFIGADPFRAAISVAEVEGWALFFDNEDYLTNPNIGDIAGLPVKWNWTERDFVSVDQLSESIPGDVLTEVTLTGSQQLLRDPSEQNAVHTTITGPQLIIEEHVSVVAANRQASNCALASVGSTPSPRQMLISATTTTIQEKGGTQVFSMTEVESLKLPEAARYVYAALGVRDCIGNVYLLTGAIAEDNNPAYDRIVEFFTLTDRQTTRTYYNRVGFTGPQAPAGEPWTDRLRGTPTSTGWKLGSISEAFGWYIQRAALKERIPGTPWEEIDPIVGRQTLGNGEAVVNAFAETFILTGREVQIIEATPDGYTKTITNYRYGWGFAKGAEYQLAGGELVGQEFETFRLIQTEIIQYVPLNNGQRHAVVTHQIQHVPGGRDVTRIPVEFFDGAPPAVERLPDDAPNPDDFETTEEFEAAMVARSYETQPIKAIFTSASLEAIHPKRQQEQSSDYAGTVEELYQMARRAVERTAAIPFSFSISVNFAVRPGDKAHIKHEKLGWDYDVQVHSLEHSVNSTENDPNAYSLTRIVAKKYPSVN